MEIENDPRYEEGKIYKVVCNITGEEYYGSTIKTLKERLRLHKASRDCKSRKIIDRGDYEMILIKDYPCNNEEELKWEERKYIETNNSINKNLPIKTKQEKKEYDKKRGHIYYKNNKEEVDKKNKKNNSIKILCECGALIRKDSMYRHIISKKHIKLLEEKSM
tara:strand:+ start:113 stop:601 length:489 start_codon:yes stop_codon:yes gene_type:complete